MSFTKEEATKLDLAAEEENKRLDEILTKLDDVKFQINMVKNSDHVERPENVEGLHFQIAELQSQLTDFQKNNN